MSYEAEVLADNPLRYYRLDETSGTNMADATETEDGTHFGPTLGVTAADPNLNTAVRYDGVDDHSEAPAASDLVGWDDFTIELWFRWAPAASGGYVMSVYNTAGDNRCWGVIFNAPQSRARMNLSTNGTGFTEVGNFSISGARDNNWHHLVYRRSGSTVTAHIDKVQIGSDTFADTLFEADQRFIVAARGDGSGTTGHPAYDCDEIALYDYAISVARIAAHYDAAFAEPPDDVSAAVSLVTSSQHLEASAEHEPEFTAEVALVASAQTLQATADHEAPEFAAAAELVASSQELAASATAEAPEFTSAATLVASSQQMEAAIFTDDPEFTAAAALVASSQALHVSAEHEPPEFAAAVDLIAESQQLEAAAITGEPEFTTSISLVATPQQTASATSSEAPDVEAAVLLVASPQQLAADALEAVPFRASQVIVLPPH